MSKSKPSTSATVVICFVAICALVGYVTILNTIHSLIFPTEEGKPTLGALPATKNDGAKQRLFWGLVPQTPTDPKYRGNHRMIVEAVGEDGVDERCGPAPAAACANPALQRVVVPNPCLYPDDPYAGLLCHEMAHLKGWEHEKGRPDWGWSREDEQ